MITGVENRGLVGSIAFHKRLCLTRVLKYDSRHWGFQFLKVTNKTFPYLSIWFSIAFIYLLYLCFSNSEHESLDYLVLHMRYEKVLDKRGVSFWSISFTR